LSAVDLSNGVVVGAIAIAPCETVNHILPITLADSELHKWILELASKHAAKCPNGLIIPLYVLDPDHEEAALLTLLRYAFSACPSLRALILLPEAQIPFNQPFLLSYFTDTGSKGPAGEKAYISTREVVCPALTVWQLWWKILMILNLLLKVLQSDSDHLPRCRAQQLTVSS
jgi:hypothetical protein